MIEEKALVPPLGQVIRGVWEEKEPPAEKTAGERDWGRECHRVKSC